MAVQIPLGDDRRRGTVEQLPQIQGGDSKTRHLILPHTGPCS